ncbi:ribosomal protein S18-alanine N-acetyltransferase [Cognatishimia sp. F0-27]|uniref:ribosomal protein S18-alanine N-acetyltransferase n=1 Tax=Cognatishimia sp. F0-27 TaxID=2816855 RepID=UPI001D0C67CD|nr:ribosomal protein S18-alanine N-acetyltransferase [Cognatishimia sp. F0-27]MCC1492846.1 ribosomal protein S18-alanine N-acetyltransferase [Cognatishimia sp. F0-27]
MAADALAALAARAYRHMKPWSSAQFAETLAAPHSILVSNDTGFVLGQVVFDEAEILALATDPAHQRRGVASSLLKQFFTLAQSRGGTRLFLEVAEDNAPAIAFYRRHGFEIQGLRRGYYRRAGAAAADACVMARDIP